MKPARFSLKKIALLASTMIFAPSIAAAQDAVSTDAGSSDEIVVRGRNIPQPMRETAEVLTVLSPVDLARQGDDNAAQALSRLAGLSVSSGRFVYVRGLGDRYSSALLNGSPLPSPEPLRRQVPLDLFPSNILEGASIQKTFSPNYPGEFGGGVINLTTLKMPSEGFVTLKAGTGGNTESTGKKGLSYYGDDQDWTTWAWRDRPIASPLREALDGGKRVNPTNFSAAQLESFGESLINSPLTVVQQKKLEPDFEGELTAGTTLDIGRFNVGLVGVVGYDSTLRSQDAKRQQVVGNIVENNFQVQTTNWDIVANAFGSASVGWEENSVTLTSFLVRTSTKKAQLGEGTSANASGTTGLHTEATAWYERELASLQLAGKHRWGAIDLSWRGAFAQSTRDAPYERDITYDETPAFPLIYSGRSLGNSTRFSDLKDQVGSAGIDASYTLPLSEQRDAIFSGGLAWSNTLRWYNQRSFAYVEPFPGLIPNSVRVNRPDYLFQPDTIGPTGFQLEEQTGRDDSYRGRLSVNAAYLGADVEVIPLVRVAAGLRYEDATEYVRTLNTFGETPFAVPVLRDKNYLLPAATVTWNFAEDLQMRLAYSQTIARPQFRELAFSGYIDPDTDRIYQGNPFLTDSEFKNYDARFEYYIGRDQFVTLGGFYKKIDKPIEEVIVSAAGRVITRFLNAPEATLYGGEAEYRVNFDMPFAVPLLSDPRWLFAANYTYTNSEVSGTNELVIDPTQLPNPVMVPASQFQLDGTPLQGTPKHIANVQFGFETEASQLTLLVGYVDKRIARRGLGALPSIIENPGVEVDLTFRRSFQFGGGEWTLGASGRNLLGTEHEEYQVSTLGKTDANTYERGRNFSVSLTAKY